MNLHEYQAKMLLSEYGIPAPPGKPVHSEKEASRVADELGGDASAVKAQAHAGGRGKAVGVKLVQDKQQLDGCVKKMLGTRLVTRQSGPKGKPVNCVLIQSISAIQSELYLGLLVDRNARRISVMASRAGGMDIEEVAAKEPEKIFSFQ